MSSSVGFAIVGLGYGGTRCAMLQQTPGAHLAAVVDANPARAREFGERYDVPWFTSLTEVLGQADVDVVALYTPTGLHRDLALQAARAGKHVLLTKPMETTLERSDEIIEECERQGVELYSEFYLRYYQDNFNLQQAIATGALGSIVLGEFGFKCFRPDDYYNADGAWRQTWELNGGGVAMNQGIHAIDLLSWCLGDVESVQAGTGAFAHDIPVEDTAVALLRLRSGALATLVTTTTYRTTSGMDDVYGGGYTTRADVNGTLGSYSVADESLQMQKVEGVVLGDFDGKPLNVFDDVAHALTDAGYTSPTLARGRAGRRPVEIAHAIYVSAREGGAVQLPLTL